MTVVGAPPPDLLRLSAGKMDHRRHFPGRSASPHVRIRSLIRASSQGKKDCGVETKDASLKYPDIGDSYGSSNLRFDRLQPPEEEIDCRHRRVFGRFVAREAMLDEEYWTAAWLRAESHWEDQPGDRHLQSNKRKFADQEFHAIKRRCKRKYAEECTCIVAMKKEEKDAKRTVLSSIVGTLDFSIRQLLLGQTFPGESAKVPVCRGIFRTDLPRYCYIANLCVSKYARRQGIASNMLLLAVDAASSYGVNEVFINVHKENTTAQKLYEKIGFEIFEKASPQIEKKKMYLLCFKL